MSGVRAEIGPKNTSLTRRETTAVLPAQQPSLRTLTLTLTRTLTLLTLTLTLTLTLLTLTLTLLGRDNRGIICVPEVRF